MPHDDLKNSAFGVHRAPHPRRHQRFWCAHSPPILVRRARVRNREAAWPLLKGTKQRQFGLSLLQPGDDTPNKLTPGVSSSSAALWDEVCIELTGLASTGGQQLNGQRGEVIPSTAGQQEQAIHRR